MKQIAIPLDRLLSFAIAFVCVTSCNLNDFEDPLLNAVRDGDVATMSALLESGVSPDQSDSCGNTALTIAGHFGQTEAAILLLEHGADLDIQDSTGMTPLHCAVYQCKNKTARLFLERGADPNLKDGYGQTPLATAASIADTEMVERLIAAGADVEVADARGWRPIHIILRTTVGTESRRIATVKTLLKAGADPNASNPGGFERDSECDSHIGSRPAAPPNRGNTPVAIAESNGYDDIVLLLKQYGGS